MKKFQNKYRIPSARATWWDYSTGSYFITICTHDRLHWFGQIHDKKMVLSPFGEIAKQCWLDLPNHFPYVELGAFTVMPNHVHGIIDIVETMHASSLQHATSDNPVDDNKILHNDDSAKTLHATSDDPVDDIEILHNNDTAKTLHATSLQMARISPKPGTLARVLGSYKSAISKLSHKIDATFEWQERYHDHIIRDTEEYNAIEYYINHNPENWEDDCFYKIN